MIFLLKQSIASTIKKSSWLDEFSRQNALDKLSQLRAVLGAPDMYFDSKYLEQMMAYASLIKHFKSD